MHERGEMRGGCRPEDLQPALHELHDADHGLRRVSIVFRWRQQARSAQKRSIREPFCSYPRSCAIEIDAVCAALCGEALEEDWPVLQ